MKSSFKDTARQTNQIIFYNYMYMYMYGLQKLQRFNFDSEGPTIS